jgi:hypothetical protein
MFPGQRVQKPFGWIEIRTFDRTEGDPSVFKVEFLAVNERAKSGIGIGRDEFRLIVDGLPHSPVESSSVVIPVEDTAEGYVVFRVNGQKDHTVYLQFGTASSLPRFGSHSLLRWPD